MSWKGFNKLTVQVIALFVVAIGWNFLQDTTFFVENFTWRSKMARDVCPHGSIFCIGTHYHWNTKGWMFFTMSFVLFVIQVVRITKSHKNEDF